jgi:hypothetical protein
MSNFTWKKYAEMIYGIDRERELADKMMKEFSKGGRVFLDDYTPEEIKKAQKLYDEEKKHKAPDNIKSEIKGVWKDKGKK